MGNPPNSGESIGDMDTFIFLEPLDQQTQVINADVRMNMMGCNWTQHDLYKLQHAVCTSSQLYSAGDNPNSIGSQ